MARQGVGFDDRGRDIATELRDGARVLRRQWWLVALLTALGALGAWLYSSSDDPEYASTARLLLLQSDPNAAALSDTTVFTDPARERATDIELIEQPAVAERVANRLDTDRSPGELLSMISTDVQGDSNVLSITATARDAGLTAPVANGFGWEFIRFEQETQRRRYRQAMKLVQARIRESGPADSRQLDRLRDQARDLRLLSTLQTGDAQFIEGAAGPGAEVGDEVARQTMLGGLLGLLVGLGLVFLRDRLDPRLRTEEEVGEALPDVPVIAKIPRAGSSATGRRASVESYHLLVADIEALGDEQTEAPFVLVTSAMAGEGKSSTALNLALAMKERGRRVTLVEADARSPDLSAFADGGGAGLASILRGEAGVDEALRTTAFEPRRGRGGPAVAIEGEVPFIPAGPMDRDHHRLLNGAGLERFLAELSSRGAAAVIDGPPLGLFSDMARLARLVDHVVVVVRVGHARRKAVQQLRGQLERAGVEPAGIVITDAPVGIGEYGRYSA